MQAAQPEPPALVLQQAASVQQASEILRVFRDGCHCTSQSNLLRCVQAAHPEPSALTLQQAPSVQQTGKTRVVVLGSGWGAIPFLKGLSDEACRNTYEVTVISPRNYFLYTPLLPGAYTCCHSCIGCACSPALAVSDAVPEHRQSLRSALQGQ